MADQKNLRTEFTGHEHISVVPQGYEPAESYRVEYRLKGVALDARTNNPVIVEHHVAQLRLTAQYPTTKPLMIMETPIFHPNFGPNVGDEICIGDFWTPGQPLSDIIVKVGEMIQFRIHNVKSPLNADAARWVRENDGGGTFPIGRVDLYQEEPVIILIKKESLNGND